MRILIIEDNQKLAEALRDVLRQERYEADTVGDGEEGYELLRSGLYDGAILDVMLPGMDGITLLRGARKQECRVPVLMLTAKSETEDKVEGLSAGADYYLTKPFETRELLAALKAILRRGGDFRQEVLSFGDISLDQSTYSLMKGEKGIRLGRKEYEVMQILMGSGSAIVSKETLLLKIWGSEGEAMDNNVEIYISFLRKKLTFLRAEARIVTVRNLGYHLSEK